MTIQRITFEEASAMLEIPFNPPAFTSEYDKERFEDDYFKVVDGLGNVLGALGEQGEDYNLDCGFVLSRGIGFEIMSYAILNKNLIPSIQVFLKSINAEYQVRANPIFMDGWSSIWNIYISGDWVKTDCPDKILKLLGPNQTVE